MPTLPLTVTLPAPPVIPSGQEIYDLLMGPIEPELLSTSLPTLNEKYKDETPEEAETRKNRYNAAFAKYHEAEKACFADLEEKVRSYEREALRSVEEASRKDEGMALVELEAQLNAA